jgi:sarcosine oxidase subunit alpha
VTARRIGRPVGSAPKADLVTFTFDGRDVHGVVGEPLAVALLAAGRPVISRSFRFHRPRGLMCSTGQCGWCECEVDGVPSVRSCRVPVRQGLTARGEHAWPSVEHDALSALGMFSRWIPPTFYHHRFLRPRSLRKRYLDVIRGFGGRGTLRVGRNEARPGAASEARSDTVAGRPARSLETDVLVIGGGPAGLNAAIGAAQAGARVVLIEADRAGRQAEVEAAASAAGVDLRPGTTAIGWYEGIVAAITDEEHLEIAAGAIIAATGSYERVPLVPGADRPGVLGARRVLELVDRHGVLPGDHALLVGQGSDLEAAGDALWRAGIAELVGPVPTTSLVTIRGGTTVTGADIRVEGRREHHAVDLVVFGDRSPNLDLVLAAGGTVRSVDGTLIPVVDEHGRTTIPNLLVAGSAAGRSRASDRGVDLATATGRAAARIASGHRPRSTRRAEAVLTATEAPPPRAAAIARGAIVCFCEDVRAWEIHAEQQHGYRDPELIKRRTGALTGPCQGKQCLQAFACSTAVSGTDENVTLPTARPPLRPIRLGDLVAMEPDDGRADA